MKVKHKNKLILSLLFLLNTGLNTSIEAETPSDDELQQLEQLIEQQEREQQEVKKRAVEEAKHKADMQKLKEEQARLEEEKRKLEEEKKRIESARQAEIDRKQQEEEAKLLAIEEQKRKQEEAENARVTLVFYRNQSYPFSGDSALISHNGHEIGKLSSKSYFLYQSPPGEQKFKAVIFRDWIVETVFDFKPGSTNFVMAAIDWTTVNLSIETVGIETINGLENTGNIDPGKFFSNYDDINNKNTGSSKSNVKFGFDN